MEREFTFSKKVRDVKIKYETGAGFKNRLECGPMPNVMAALPNIGGAFCPTPQSLADAHWWL